MEKDIEWAVRKTASEEMTLRDYFAAKAMQAMLAGEEIGAFRIVAEGAYLIADAMLKQRTKQ